MELGSRSSEPAIGAKNPTGNEILDPIVIEAGDGIVGTVALTGVPEVIADTREDPRFPFLLRIERVSARVQRPCLGSSEPRMRATTMTSCWPS